MPMYATDITSLADLHHLPTHVPILPAFKVTYLLDLQQFVLVIVLRMSKQELIITVEPPSHDGEQTATAHHQQAGKSVASKRWSTDCWRFPQQMA
jgi:hypothetical protein